MTMQKEQNQDWYIAQFEAFERGLNGESRSDLHMTRRHALMRFVELGFPTTKDEEWRFTSVAPIEQGRFASPLPRHAEDIRGTELQPFTFGGLRCNRMVFLDGRYSARLSGYSFLGPGVKIGSLAEALREDPGAVLSHLTRYARYEHSTFTALNTAFLQDGAYVSIPDGVTVRDPIHMLFVSTGRGDAVVCHPRNLVVTGDRSRVTVVESYVSLGGKGYFTNAVTELAVGSGSVVEHDRLEHEADDAFHIGSIHAQLQAGSSLTTNSVSLGGHLVRNNLTVVFAAEGSECTLNGLSLSTGEQLIDNHTMIDHAMPHCTSHELYKAILDGRSRGVFGGKIIVRKDAQKTDAKQTNRTLLLSDEATMDTKPQLEIFADDVKCTHGAAVGALDDEQVFYLRSRGIDEAEARDLLTTAFAGDVVGRIQVVPFRRQLERLIHDTLRQGTTGPARP